MITKTSLGTTAFFSWCLLLATAQVSFADVRRGEELPELLIPVTGTELASQKQRNDYFLKSTLYFAKRHRFVKVDFDVLQNSEEFNISLFPNTTVYVTRSSLFIEPDSSVSWQGWFEDLRAGRPLKPTTTIIEGLEVVAADPKRDVTIVGICFDYEPTTGRSFASRSDKNIEGFSRSPLESNTQKSAFYGFTSEIYVPSEKSTYKITALSLTPDIHVVYEVDESKEYLLEWEGDQDNDLRKAEHLKFLETLGDNPKNEWKRRHKGEIQ